MGRKIIKTFYDWCIENDRQDLLDRFDVEINKCTAKDVSCKANKNIILNVQEVYMIVNHFICVVLRMASTH